MLSLIRQKSLQNFAVVLGLHLSNINIPTRISKNKRGLEDHCFLTNEQINTSKICLLPFDIDHNIFLFQSKLLLLEGKQSYFFRRQTKKFFDEKFNRDLAPSDCKTVYQPRH